MLIAATNAPSGGWLGTYMRPDDQPHVMTIIDEAIRTEGVFQHERRVRRVDGTLGWMARASSGPAWRAT